MMRRATAGWVLLAVLALVVAAQSEPAARTPAAAPFLWQGQLGSHRLALFGTIHVPDPRVLALSPAVRAAFDRADRVVTEIPLDRVQQGALAAALVLPEGQRLRAIVGDAVFARLETRVRTILTPLAPEMTPLVSGMLDRYPKLKFVSVESGLGWVPFMLESLDYQYNYLTDRPNFELSPSEYFRRNFYACFWFEKRDLSHLVNQIGVDNCMFETDFPHPVSLHPAPLDYIEEGLAQLDDTARQKVMSGNAAKVYNIPL